MAIPPPIRALTVCVEYDDFLAITLPRAARHFDSILVVSRPDDSPTAKVVETVEKAQLYTTEAFYRNGADFNKGLAIEEALDILGRQGWICVLDADIVLPRTMDLSSAQPGSLYVPRRRICEQPRDFDGEDWSRFREASDAGEFPGFFQLFHAEDPVLQTRPWYGIDWRHAGGCDSDFMFRWPAERRRLLPFEVLHLGMHGQNWHGRWTARLDGRPIRRADRRREKQRRMYLRRRRWGYRVEHLPGPPSTDV